MEVESPGMIDVRPYLMLPARGAGVRVVKEVNRMMGKTKYTRPKIVGSAVVHPC
jgi:hypothetical protein